MLYTDFNTRLPEHLLMLVDRMGMVHGLEVRSPLVDRELVEYMARVPLRMKVRGLKARYIEYRLAEKLLPRSIAGRKKRGFRFPLAFWFAVKLHSFVARTFEASALVEDGIFDGRYMATLLEEHRRRRIDHSWRIWMLLNLEVWYRMNIRAASREETETWIEGLAGRGSRGTRGEKARGDE
jgi:asparagine synthase (glutamine-hydrolysing)